MGNLKLQRKSNNLPNKVIEQESIKKIDIQNLFSYLKQEIGSSGGLIDKTKALTNVLLKENIFRYLIQSSIKKTTANGISIGSESIEGYTYTSVHTQTNEEEHYSIYARCTSIRDSINLRPGVVKGFLLRKEKTRKAIKNILEARLVLSHGKECTLKYDYTLANL